MPNPNLISHSLDYHHDGAPLEGYLAYDANKTGSRPGVIIVHQWKGLTEYEMERARMIADLGYVALAIDVYGKGKRPQAREEGRALIDQFRNDRPLFRARVQAGVNALRQQPNVDTAHIAAIGYCFGGGGVLELARSGSDVLGVASFHGTLDTPLPAEPGQIKAKILVLHGANDPHISDEKVLGFRDEMTAAQADWQFISYGGAVHSFTEKEVGDDASKGAAYNEKADRRSWAALRLFLEEVFAE